MNDIFSFGIGTGEDLVPILIMYVVVLILTLFLFIFWIAMLVHVASNEDLKDRTMWLVILIAGFVTGLWGPASIAYYIVAKKPYDQGERDSNFIETQPQQAVESTQQQPTQVVTPEAPSQDPNPPSTTG